jgi:hypothetical protein
MVRKGVLRETAVGRDQSPDPAIEELAAFLRPTLPAELSPALAIPSQPRATGEKSSSFAGCVIVVLCDGVNAGEVNTTTMGLDETN